MSRTQRENELVMWHVQALAAAHDGRLDEAEHDSKRAMEMAREAGLPERAAVIQAAMGVWSAFYGNRDAARLEAETALKAFDARPEDKFETACRYAYAAFGTGKDQFHRNIRAILDECWPSLSFHEQLRRTWITESVLCSASVECGSVPSSVARACVERYLDRELALFPNAVVVALGGKAQDRMKGLQRRYIRAGSVAPPGCNQRAVRESWKSIAAAVHPGE